MLTMYVPINVKSPNNTSKWQMGFNLAFKGLMRETQVQITCSIETANCTTDFQFVITILTSVPTRDLVENTKTYFEIYFVFVEVYKVKDKAIPLQAWTGREGSRSLRLPDFKTVGT
jgi:hypothetical protein